MWIICLYWWQVLFSAIIVKLLGYELNSNDGSEKFEMDLEQGSWYTTSIVVIFTDRNDDMDDCSDTEDDDDIESFVTAKEGSISSI